MRWLILCALLLVACDTDPEPVDGSSTDGGSTDGGSMDGGSMDGGRPDGSAPIDGGAPTDGSVDDAGVPPTTPDPSTLTGKLMFGYQGWFSAPGDGSRIDGWRHWSGSVPPASDTVSFDAWPDMTDYVAAGVPLYDTALRYPDGSVARLYSAYDAEAVDLHFRWMQEHGLDGVFLQEFVGELTDGSASREFRDQVTRNVMAGSEAHERVFAIMYDISGADPATLVARIRAHWEWVVGVLAATSSPRYLRHRGRPVVAIWGLGFADRSATPAVANALLDYFETDAPDPVTVMGGVPTNWRTLDGDARSDPAWTAIYRRFDVISPWAVGRMADDAGVAAFRRDRVAPDLAATTAAGQDYMPVIFPGFSWANLMSGAALNQIPRRAGRFWWTQLHEYVGAGATMIYGAMFDEVDESTAMYEVAATTADLPATGTFLSLDADGYSLPSDFYLSLAGEGGRALRGEIPLTADPPIGGATPSCDPPNTVEVDGRCVPSCGAAGGDSCDAAVCASRPHLESYDCAVCCSTAP